MSFNLVMTSRAQSEVEIIYDYIYERNPDGALRWFRAFQMARDELEENPERFGYAPENAKLPQELRQRFFSTKRGNRYRIIFKIADNNVFIMHVREQGQDLVDD